MNALDALRAANARVIAENPVTVAIRRVEFVDDGTGGRVRQESAPPTFTGRVVTAGQARDVWVATSEAGQRHLASVVLIAPWDADLRAGSDVEDTFEAGGRCYRVTRVVDRAHQGAVYAKHAVLEEVG